MSGKTEFQVFLEEEIKKVKGVYYPVKAGYWRTRAIRWARVSRLHPNPGDEFCDPEIGPNYEIISRYRKMFGGVRDSASAGRFAESDGERRILVEKTAPEGYMILNGHHRWAAAVELRKKWVPIEVVDLTRKKDVKKMLDGAASDRRATLDLDEAVFAAEGDTDLEKALPFPANRLFRQRLRKGIPALFHFLKEHGYDIWVYTSNYYSVDYIRRFFWYYRVGVTGALTGIARKTPGGGGTVREMETMIAERYHTTLHIDSRAVVCTFREPGEYEEYPLSGSASGWSAEVMDIVEGMKPRDQAG